MSLQERVDAFPFWYHRIELPGGVVTPGKSPLNEGSYGLPADLSGKRVLDVGAWDGFWTFRALQRGARQVIAIDDFSDYLGLLKPEDRKAWGTFDLCREALGYDTIQCQREELSVYDVTESRIGRFDVVFFFGTLYHLRHPLLALDKLGGVCDDLILIESAICDDFSPYRKREGRGGYGSEMVMEFYPDAQLAKNVTNWWAPTLECMAHMARVAGFSRDIKMWKLVDDPQGHAGLARGFVYARKEEATADV